MIAGWHSMIHAGAVVVPTVFRFLRMVVSSRRNNASSNPILQFSEIKLIDGDGSAFPWPSGTSVSASFDGKNISCFSNETPAKLIDGNTSTKMAAQNGNRLPAVITIDLGSINSVDTETYSRWSWYTANDAPDRDPVSFSFLASVDGETWFQLDSAENVTITTTRRALAYTGAFPSYQQGGGG